MGDTCCQVIETPDQDRALRRALWIALLVNALMFLVEVAGSVTSGSVSLLADAVDFLGDAANYGISLFVLPLGVAWRARAALLKGLTMGAFGVFVFARTGLALADGAVPEPLTMGAVAITALAANVGVAALLYTHRRGDANMRAVWLCSRNDAIGNVAVSLAAVGVFETGTLWPDLIVAAVMALLALTASAAVVRHALQELDSGAVARA
ncbi:MAG: cation transporter [Vicinamibacterales bacterium]